MALLITGGCGFIGANLRRMVSATREIRVYDNLSRPAPGERAVLRDKLIEGDIRDFDALKIGLAGANQVVHLAAYGSVIESLERPLENFEHNVIGTFNVVGACQETGIERLVFASTGGALIGDAEPPVSEDSLPKPISPYGASKLCGEAYCQAFAKGFGLETVALRFGNVYGPFSAHKKGAVTVFIKALIKGEPIVIYGDGSASRDYVHVEDLCSGIVAALDAPVSAGSVFHLASGRETTVLKLAELLRDIAGKPHHPIEFRPARRGEVTRNFASYERAEKELGFAPKWRLEDGLAATWDWFVDQGEKVLAVETTDS